MDNIKHTSVDRVISKVVRDFGISDISWKSDAIEWIGYALLEIGTFFVFEPLSKEVLVEDNKFKLDIDVECLLGIEYNNIWLNCLNKPNIVNRDPTSKHYYTLKPNYVNTDLNNVTVKVHYLGFSVDCDGFPTVPDNIHVLEALAWNVMYHLLLQGFKHPVITLGDANQAWTRKRDNAINEMLFPRPDSYAAIMAAWASNFPNYHIHYQ